MSLSLAGGQATVIQADPTVAAMLQLVPGGSETGITGYKSALRVMPLPSQRRRERRRGRPGGLLYGLRMTRYVP